MSTNRDAKSRDVVGDVSKPRGHGTSMFSKFSNTEDRLCGLLLPEEPQADTVVIREDVKAKLLARQQNMRAAASANSDTVTAPAASAGAVPALVPVTSRTNRSPSTSSASNIGSSTASDEDRRANLSSSDGDSYVSDDDAVGQPATADGTHEVPEETSAAGDFSADFLSFDAVKKPGMAGASSSMMTMMGTPKGSAVTIPLKGPSVSGLEFNYDPRTFGVIPDFRFGNGTIAPLAVPLWCMPRYQRTGRLYCTTNAAVALHEEISDLFDWLRPTEAEVVMRRLIEVELSDIATGIWPTCKPCAYGSLSTHLMLPTSDVDMTILDVPVNTEDALLSICKQVAANRLGATSWPQMILKTKVPLVKFATRIGAVEVDVSVNAGDGKVNSDLVKGLCARFPESKFLIPIIKYFLQQREMNEPFRGTIGSFATTLLVLSFLQQHPIYTTRTDLRPQYGLGRLLLEFFRYYALSFNFHRVGLSLANGGSCFPRNSSREQGGPRGPAQVIVEDPGNSSNNVASSLRQYQQIRAAFDGAYHALSADVGLTRLHSPMDPAVVNPIARQVLLRPTLLSRIIHSDNDVATRREKADRGLAEFEATMDAEKVARVKAHKRAEDKPLLELKPRKPASDIATTMGLLSQRVRALNESVYSAPYAAGRQQQQHQQPPQQQQHHQYQQDRGGRRGRENDNMPRQPARAQPMPPPPPIVQIGGRGRGGGGQQQHQANTYNQQQHRGGQHQQAYSNHNSRNNMPQPTQHQPPPVPNRGRGGGGNVPPPPVNVGPPVPNRGRQQQQQQQHRQQPQQPQRGGRRNAPYREASSSSDDGGNFGNWQGRRGF